MQNGYVNNIMIGKFPFFVLFMELPPTMVDVNVHPNKLEVRFGMKTSGRNSKKSCCGRVKSRKTDSGLEDRAQTAEYTFYRSRKQRCGYPSGTIYPPKRAFAGADADTGIKNPPEDAANNTQASAEDGTQDKVREASGGCADNSNKTFRKF